MLLHVMGNNLTTRIDGDQATAESYNLALRRQGSAFFIMNAAANRWTLQKIDGRWKIEEWMLRSPGAQDFNKVHVTVE
jgi:hypothetical protein